jgi:hypothetical protein
MVEELHLTVIIRFGTLGSIGVRAYPINDGRAFSPMPLQGDRLSRDASSGSCGCLVGTCQVSHRYMRLSTVESFNIPLWVCATSQH